MTHGNWVLKLWLPLFAMLLMSASARADTLVIKPSYSTERTSTSSGSPTDGANWVGITGSTITRLVTAWPLSGINSTWVISSVEARFYALSKTGSPGTLALVRYGSSHGEDSPQTDSVSVAYGKIAGVQYASLPEPAATGWTSWVDLGATALADLQWCLSNAKPTWSVGLKASTAVESAIGNNHIDLSEDNQPNPSELRITYTVNPGGFETGTEVTITWDQSIGFSILSCKTDCTDCVVTSEVSLPLVGKVINGSLTFETNWPSVKITGGCSGDKNLQGKFSYGIVDSAGVEKLTGETINTEVKVVLNYPAGDYVTRVKTVLGTDESAWASVPFKIVEKSVQDGSVLKTAPKTLTIK